MSGERGENYPSSYGLSWRDRLPGPLGALAAMPWVLIAVALLAGLLLADQIRSPSSRVIKALGGVVIFYLAYRTKPFHALCFIGLLLLFPFTIFVGSSTMIFIVLVFLIYLVRLTQRRVEALQRTPVDVGVALLFAAYLLSFYNIENPAVLRGAVFNMIGIVASFMLYFLTANFIRNEAQLRTFVKILSIAVALSIFVAMYELFLPGRVLIPHWILYSGANTEGGVEGYRVGGPMYDFELMGEFMAMSFFLSIFVLARARSAGERAFGIALSVMCVFTLLTTVTRGATLAFMGGVVYFVWAIRRQVRFRDLVTAALIAAALYFGLEFIIMTFTRSGSVADRLFKTEFVGVIPDSRAGWPKIWARVLEQPIFGHGPYYDLGLTRGFTGKSLYMYQWPHNQYLYYAHTIGFFGVATFLYVVGRLLALSFHWKAPSLGSPSYARSLMVVLHVMLLVFVVDQIKIEYLRNSIYQYFPWMLFGLIAATWRIIQNEEAAKRPAATG